MHTETLLGDTKKTLAILGRSGLFTNAYLAGGSACALQLGHRISVDLDFFTPDEFDTKSLIKELKKISKFEVDQEKWGTVLGTINCIKFSIFVYEYKVLFPYEKIFDINVLDLRDIGAMKLDAISTRGIMRDFIDLYFICRHGVSLAEIFNFYERKYGRLSSNSIHIQKSLIYFVDAEASEVPKMLKPCKWDDVKRYFEKEIKKMVNAS